MRVLKKEVVSRQKSEQLKNKPELNGK